MLYLKKIPPLEISINTPERLVIERPRDLSSLYFKLFIAVVVGVVSVYTVIVYQYEIQSSSLFLLLACFAPILFLFISSIRLINAIRGWKIVFDKKAGLLLLNNQQNAVLAEIKELILNNYMKKDGTKEWFYYELYLTIFDDRKIILATSRSTEVLNKLGYAISAFLNVELAFTNSGKAEKHMMINRTYDLSNN